MADQPVNALPTTPINIPPITVNQNVNSHAIAIPDAASSDKGDLKKKRKTDASEEERKYVCAICTRRYLSYPALYLHSKTKHGPNCVPGKVNSAKSRGRPRKINSAEFAKSKEYFNAAEKKGKVNDIMESIIEVLTAMSYNSEHAIVAPIKRAIAGVPINKDTSNCDDIFAEYLVFVSTITNKEFYLKVVKFILLYRDCFYMSTKGATKTITNADTIPDYSNDFVSTYITDKKFSNILAIELTQNFCEWLYKHNYTTLKITLL